MGKLLQLNFTAFLLVLCAAYSQCQIIAQPMCPVLTSSFGVNITYSPSLDNLVDGTSARYDPCKGFSVGTIGQIERFCESNFDNTAAAWSGQEPQCTLLLCNNTLEAFLENGIITYGNSNPELSELLLNRNGMPNSLFPNGGYPRDTVATYTCNPGFVLNRDGNDLCRTGFTNGRLSSVDWISGDRTCTKQCPDINLNGRASADLRARGLSPRISYTNMRILGSIATHQCRGGLVAVGNLTRTCIRNASSPTDLIWSQPVPLCVAECQALAPIPNGVITYGPDMTADFDVGTNATHTCDPGFRLFGPETRECLGSGRWSGMVPVCRAQCPELEPIPNGSIRYGPDFTPDFDSGTVATYSCDRGFFLVESGPPGTSINRTCLISMTWSGQAPMCQPVQCPPLPLIPNGVITYGPDMTADFDVGTNATHTCDDNFILIIGSEIRECLYTGIWSGITPVCQPVECPPLQPIPNGVITYGPDMIADFAVGTNATHTCNEGYLLLGGPRTCLPGGIWSGLIPVCQRLCPALEPIPNGAITYGPRLDDFNVGTLATYTCNAGFVRFGSETRRCLPGGIWSELAPECLPPCPVLPTIPNGVITYGPDTIAPFEVDTVATHTCNENFRLFGNEARVCLASGRWSGFTPVCLPLECPALPPIPNGNITYDPDMTADFDVGTVATHTCNDGFTLVGSEIRECLPRGTWSGLIPVCIPIQCPPLPMFPNGMITYSLGPSPNFPIGTTAVYECNAPEGYCLSAATLRECQPSGTWSGAAPELCGRITCEILVIINGEVVYSDESQIQDGTTANQMCREGFVLTGSSNRTCIGVSQTPVICGEFMGNWTGPAGICVGNFVNDTAIGDPLMTVPLNIADKTSFFEASINNNTNNNIGPNDIINLCYELHGRRDAFVNLVSDECISVNAHYELVQPNEPREDINIIDNIYVRATDNVGTCQNIRVALNEGGVCTASVNGANIADMYQANGISIRRYTNRVRIMVPNCEDVNLVMWVFCRQSTFWSTFRTDNNGAELTFQADMIKFVIARGFNLRERSHGIIGQFWNIPILVEPFTGSIRSSTPVSTDNLYQVTVQHPNESREFTAWLYPLTWEYRREYCLYAGNQQAGSVYEVESPNDPVIEGTYADYIVDTAYGTDFAFTHFNERRCNSVVIG